MGGCLYLCYPQDKYLPGVGGWVRACVDASAGWPNWKVQTHEYDGNNSLRAQIVHAQVIARPGPVLLINRVQYQVVQELRLRLNGRVSVLVRDCYDAPTIAQAMDEAREQFEAGDPQLARNFVVALLLLRKLDQERMWAGNAKGYMWMDDLPKGRGIPGHLSNSVAHSVNLLLQHDFLVKKTSKSTSKYALNPKRREEIYTILRDRRFPEALMKVLVRDQQTETARSLDILGTYDAPSR